MAIASAKRSFLLLCLLIVFLLTLGGGTALAGERRGTVTFSIEVPAPREAGNVKLWFPYSTTNYFMYPYTEVEGKALDYCRPRTFHFIVS
ncbi:hypothetical protein L4X63_13415 [Geomonas sp. Red32]|uniref:hypothetical protein n=1 Tax=Geomonas sp. Red32 TaxID=2912856 RepID=UPI00202CB96E|nr:hypothetical protein [Geomonas sp. Red32]MCM0082593.1 hypothetical protein [Geomonas sp. Red32]